MAEYKYIIENTIVGDITVYSQDDYITNISFCKDENDDLNVIPGMSQGLSEAIVQLDQYLNGNLTEFSLQIACEATEFEQTVWTEICKVPYGETISYKELAKRCGNPKAYRAVANACGRNIIPIIIPCHRIISSSGAIGGYKWDIEVKKKLLQLEKDNKRQNAL